MATPKVTFVAAGTAAAALEAAQYALHGLHDVLISIVEHVLE
jgi:hypothetical protein